MPKRLDQVLTELSDATSLSGADQRLAGGMNLPNLGDVLLNYSGFIDPHKFGAKGDTVKYRDGITFAGNNNFESPAHTFTTADIGKNLYVDVLFGARTVTGYVNSHTITFSGAAPSTGGTTRYWVMGTDDTVALRTALSYAGMNRGRGIAGGLGNPIRNLNYGSIVLLRANGRYLVNNTSADLTAGRMGALEIPPRCGIVGLAGVRNSQIVIAPTNYGHGVTNLGHDQYGDFMTVANMSIDALTGISTDNCLNGLHFDVAFNGFNEVDVFNNIFNVDVREARGSGIFIDGRGELIMSNCRITNARGHGLEMVSTMDSRVIAVTTLGSGKSGFRLDKTGTCHFVACKASYAGARGLDVDVDSAGWAFTTDVWLSGGNQYIGCESQETRGSGFLIKTGRGHFIGCKSADPGRYDLANSGTRTAVRAGFAFQTAMARLNTMSDCVVQPDLGVWADSDINTTQNEVQNTSRSTRNWGWGTDSVYLDSSCLENRGQIWTFPLTDYDQANAATGGSGRNNGKNTSLRVDNAALT